MAREHGFGVEEQAAQPTPGTPAGVRLARRLGLSERPVALLRCEAGQRWLSAGLLGELDQGRFAFVLDLVRGVVRLGHRVLDLRRRAMQLKLLRCLAESPGVTVTAERIAARVWNAPYHPIRHHSRLTVAIARLRGLLGQEIVQAVPEGYTLIPPGAWLVIDPVLLQPERQTV
jgi:DNA-binding response OmpR family regulator